MRIRSASVAVLTGLVVASLALYLGRFTLCHVLSREHQEVELFNGRVDGQKCGTLLDTLIPAETIDEAFVCGKGQEIQPVVAIDRMPVGDGTVGPVTIRLRERYFDVVRGLVGDRAAWRTPVA